MEKVADVERLRWDSKNITLENTLGRITGLERIDGIKSSRLYNTGTVDFCTNQFYSLLIGGAMDFELYGRETIGEVLANRVFNVVMNVITPVHTYVRNNLYKRTRTTKDSNPFRKFALEVLALDAVFPVTVAIGITLNNLIFRGEPDFQGAFNSALGVVMLSPWLALSYPWITDRARDYCGLKRAAEYGEVENADP